MGGFMPLIEAFLAFTLTMVALTMAVSTLLSLYQRAIRVRARGLRQMMVYLYRNEIAVKLDALKADPLFPNSTTHATLWALPAAGRTQFLVDMTLLPIERPSEPGEPDPRLHEVKLNRWRDLNKALDGLTEQEFLTRLRASEVGQAVLESAPGRAEELFLLWRDRFNALGRAASERFARQSRRGTVILGFVLAFSLNIDAFNLLSRYMTNPDLAASVLAKQDAILTGKGLPPADSPEANELAKKITKLEDVAVQISGSLGQAGQTLSESLAPLKNAAEATRTSLQLVNARIEDTRAAMEATRTVVIQAGGTLAGLSSAFPIGWAAYPNCVPGVTDPRCAEWRQRPAAKTSDCWLTQWIPGLLREDMGNAFKWLLGLIVTGAFLGLGTPFWVEIFNNFLRARSLITNFRATAKNVAETLNIQPGDEGAASPPASPQATARRLL
jgi:hypothetical protein